MFLDTAFPDEGAQAAKMKLIGNLHSLKQNAGLSKINHTMKPSDIVKSNPMNISYKKLTTHSLYTSWNVISDDYASMFFIAWQGKGGSGSDHSSSFWLFPFSRSEWFSACWALISLGSFNQLFDAAFTEPVSAWQSLIVI